MPIPKNRDETRGSVEEPDFHAGEKHSGLTIFDKSEPRSVYNLVSAEMQQYIDRVNPKIWEYSFRALENHARPDATLAQLRVAFWHEYNETQDKWRKSIQLTRVYHGICSKQHFYTLIKEQMNVAYMMYPTTDYIAAMQEMHDLSIREIRKVLCMPNSGKKGANLPVIREKIKIFALLENRLRGSIPVRVQREEKHMHVHAHTTIDANQQEAPKSIADIQKEINRINRTVGEEMRKAPKDVLPSRAEVMGED